MIKFQPRVTHKLEIQKQLNFPWATSLVPYDFRKAQSVGANVELTKPKVAGTIQK